MINKKFAVLGMPLAGCASGNLIPGPVVTSQAAKV
ncbi:hypothetical protein CHELA1G2_11078 [Hyphomicrobiales bacterium]|nr:hypothetical protein CHELA1G2_11078 [Hyphomicrobiales bacterium]